MKKFLTILALLVGATLCHADDLPLLGVSNFKTSGSPPPSCSNGPGDVVGSATAWWGLRAYTKSICTTGTQAAINLERASDSHTCDVLVAATGLGNTANCSTGGDNGEAVATWCNGTTCSATELYDQTGNGNNITQSTGADQPTLSFSCLGSLPCLNFNGTSDFLRIASMAVGNQPLSSSSVARSTTSAAQQAIWCANCGGMQVGFYASDTDAYIYANVSVLNSSGTVAINQEHAVNVVFNTSSSVMNVDGSETTGNPGNVNPGTTNVSLGDVASSTYLNGDLEETGIWASTTFTSGNRTSLCQNQQAFYGASNFGATC